MAMGTEQQPKRELYVRRLKFDSLILLFYIGVGSHYIITYFFFNYRNLHLKSSES